MGTTRARLLIALLALLVLAGACGSDDDAESAVASDETADRSDAGSDDAEATMARPDADDEESDSEAMEEESDSLMAGADEAMSEDAMSEGDDAAEAAVEQGGEGARSAAPTDGGFFPDEDEDEAEPEEDTAATFEDYGIRPFVDTDRDPLSTFALDVDTASYSLARQWLESGSIPPREAVRVEEYVNSFDYDYDAPRDGLAVQADAGPSPFDPDNVIVRLGVQAEQVANSERPTASLTFVVDTSGSMDRVDRLGLVKASLTRLVAELNDDDTVAIVTYSDDATVLLDPTPARSRGVIIDAIDSLQPTGSTNLEAGLDQGYRLAGDAFQDGAINRVVLASDGIANVGLTDADGLARMIRDDADRGIQLVTVGVGMGGFNDVVMEQLADQGDGFYAYVDDLGEAERLFGDELVSTLLTVALDAKIQVEFNPDTVERYRLIGFENRAVLDDDFRNDDVDAGELGAGHQVTALYELTLRTGFGGADGELGTVRLRWEDPEDGSVDETSLRLGGDLPADAWGDTDDDYRLAVTVAAWAELLRESPHAGEVTMAQIEAEVDALSSGSGAVEELADLIALSRR